MRCLTVSMTGRPGRVMRDNLRPQRLGRHAPRFDENVDVCGFLERREGYEYHLALSSLPEVVNMQAHLGIT